MFTLRQRHDKLFDESSHVLVGDDFAFPFLYTENFVRNLNDHIFLHFALTCQTPVFLNLFTREKALFCRQDFPASFQYLCTALATFTTTTTSRRQEDTTTLQTSQQSASYRSLNIFFSIYLQVYIS